MSEEQESQQRVATPQRRFTILQIDKPFFWLLLCFLSVVYIAMRNYYDKLWREEQALEEEVKNLRSEAITLTAELMRSSKESEVAQMLKNRDMTLEESRKPPIRIKAYKR